MPVEIERKFLPAGDAWRGGVVRTVSIAQGYLVGAQALDAGQARAAVRVRLAGESAWLTIKEAVAGVTRDEYEYSLPVPDAARMLETLCAAVVRKRRHIVAVGGFEFEVDEFLGDNQGLVVIEIELDDEDQEYPHPAWLGREVSGEVRYYNVNLARHPYRDWTGTERSGC